MTVDLKKEIGGFLRILPHPIKSWDEDVAQMIRYLKRRSCENRGTPVILKSILFVYRFGLPLAVLSLLVHIFGFIFIFSVLGVLKGISLYGGDL